MGEVIIRKILLGFDGSEGSERAADLAIGLAQRYEAAVVVCHAFGHMPMTARCLA